MSGLLYRSHLYQLLQSNCIYPPPFILCESLSGEAADSKNTTLSRSTARSEELQNKARFFFSAVAMRSVTIDPGS